MLFRKALFALALSGAAIPAAFANSDTGWAGNERGVGIQANTSTNTNTSIKSRADVQKELEAFRRNSVTADGGTIVDTNIGYINPQHSYAFQGGKLAHTDNIANTTPKPSVVMTDGDRRLYRQLYSR
jgi:hypothetical protein